MAASAGAVVLVRFPFSDLSNSKLFTSSESLIARQIGQLKSEAQEKVTEAVAEPPPQTRPDQEIADSPFPRYEQMGPGWIARGLWPVPGSLPGCGRAAQGWESLGEVPIGSFPPGLPLVRALPP